MIQLVQPDAMTELFHAMCVCVCVCVCVYIYIYIYIYIVQMLF